MLLSYRMEGLDRAIEQEHEQNWGLDGSIEELRPPLLVYSQFPFNIYKVSVPPFVSLRVRAKFHSGRNSKHGGTETL